MKQLIQSGWITMENMVAYLSGSINEGGTTFLEINNVEKVLKAAGDYLLPTFREHTNKQ